MFKSHQVLNPIKLIKNFGSIVTEMTNEPQAILIVPRKGDKLVIVNADIFEDLVEFKYGRNNLEERKM